VYAGALGTQNIFAIAGFFDSEKTYLEEFIRSFKKVRLADAADIALNTGIDFVGNSFFRKSWVDALEPLVKARLISRFATSVPNTDVQKGPEMFQSQNILNTAALDTASFFPT
jgi:hypothetical protein